MWRFMAKTLLLAGLATLGGCSQDQSPTKPAQEAPVVAQKERPDVARILFLDLQECCECTRNRIDTSWNALQAALSGDDGAPPVERIHMDTQSDRAAPWLETKPVMVAPGLYFLGRDDKLQSFLQGEVREDQVTDVLGPGS